VTVAWRRKFAGIRNTDFWLRLPTLQNFLLPLRPPRSKTMVFRVPISSSDFEFRYRVPISSFDFEFWFPNHIIWFRFHVKEKKTAAFDISTVLTYGPYVRTVEISNAAGFFVFTWNLNQNYFCLVISLITLDHIFLVWPNFGTRYRLGVNFFHIICRSSRSLWNSLISRRATFSKKCISICTVCRSSWTHDVTK